MGYRDAVVLALLWFCVDSQSVETLAKTYQSVSEVHCF
jgi:hypothetical protein